MKYSLKSLLIASFTFLTGSAAMAVPVSFVFTTAGNNTGISNTGNTGSQNFTSTPQAVLGGTITVSVVAGGPNVANINNNAFGMGMQTNPQGNRLGGGEQLTFSFNYTPGIPGATVTITSFEFPLGGAAGPNRLQPNDALRIIGQGDFVGGPGGIGSVNVAGLGLSTATATFVNQGGGNGFRIAGVTVDVAPPAVGAVPEPSSVLFMATALAGICYVRRRRSA